MRVNLMLVVAGLICNVLLAGCHSQSTKPDQKNLQESVPEKQTDSITMKERTFRLKKILERISDRSKSPTPQSEAVSEEEMRETAKAYVVKSLRGILPLISECHTNSVKNNPDLEGQFRVRFGVVGVPEYGAVVDSSQVLTQDATVTEESLLECVRESIYLMRLDSPPITDHRIIVEYPFVFTQQKNNQHEPNKPSLKRRPATYTFEKIELKELKQKIRL